MKRALQCKQVVSRTCKRVVHSTTIPSKETYIEWREPYNVNKSCHAHVKESRVIHNHESCHTHIWMSRVTHISMSHITHVSNRVTHMWTQAHIKESRRKHAGWRRLIGSLKLQIIFHKRAIKYRSLLRKMTCKDKGSYESLPPCNNESCHTHV